MNQIKIKSNELAERLNVLGKAQGNKSMPILDYILVEPVCEGTVRLTSTDAAVRISTEINVRGEITDKALISYDWLNDVCKACNGASTITLTYNTDNYAISASTLDAVINGNLSKYIDDYPEEEQVEYDYCTRIEASLLTEAIDRVKFAVSKDETRLILTGVLVERETDMQINCAATDGRLLAWQSVINKAISTDERKVRIVLPIPLANVIKTIGDDIIRIDNNAERICIKSRKYRITSNLIEAIYPNYKAVLPQYESYAIVSRNALMQSLKRAKTFGPSSSGLTRLEIKNRSLAVIASDDDRDVQSSIPCVVEGDDRAIGVSGEFMLTELSNLSGDMVKIYYGLPDRPVVLEGADDTLKMLLMPMFLNEIYTTPLERAMLAMQDRTDEERSEHTDEEQTNEEEQSERTDEEQSEQTAEEQTNDEEQSEQTDEEQSEEDDEELPEEDDEELPEEDDEELPEEDDEELPEEEKELPF